MQLALQDIGQLTDLHRVGGGTAIVRSHVIWPFLTYLANRVASLI